MTPERAQTLRNLIGAIMHDQYSDARRAYDTALALIDAELAKPEVCVWPTGEFFGKTSCGYPFPDQLTSDCPHCGKRVEVA